MSEGEGGGTMTMTTMTEVRRGRLGGKEMREIRRVRLEKIRSTIFFFFTFFQVVQAEAVATEWVLPCYSLFPLDYITSYSIRTKNSNMYIMTRSTSLIPMPPRVYIDLHKAEYLRMHL